MLRGSTYARVLTSLSLVAAAGAGASGCGDDDDDGVGGSTSELQLCVDETNRYRALEGREPLVRSSALEAFAAVGAEQDTQSQRAHGHFGDTGGGGVAFAENACPSWLGWTLGPGEDAVGDAVKQCVKAFYDEGPGGGHYDIMMGTYGSLGCGLYVENGAITIIQDYGN